MTSKRAKDAALQAEVEATFTTRRTTKRYVLLEYTEDLPSYDKDDKHVPIPNWPEILDGAVKVTNWKNITQDSLLDFAVASGVGQVISEHEGLTAEEVVTSLEASVTDGTDVQEEINPWEGFEGVEAGVLLEAIEETGLGILTEVMGFLQIDRGILGTEEGIDE